MDPAPGVSIRPNVRLVAPIGRGGMGAVWSAEHLGLGAAVAVKFVAPGRLAKDPTLGERLRREASVAAKLTSPHALRVHDYGETADGTPFLVMEKLSGETLAARLAREGRLALADVAAIVAQTSSALAAAHAIGIVHRDVKIENLFLLDADDGLFIKLLDFGVAKDLSLEQGDSLTESGAVLGTPYTMAPEQLLGAGEIDPRADVWSLGVVAYQVLVGRRPFEGATGPALSMAICGGAFTPPSERIAGLPPAIDSWFGRSLAVDRERRFASVREQARAFALAISAPEADPSSEPRLSARDPPAPSGDATTEDAHPGAGAREAAGGARLGSRRTRRAWIAVPSAVAAASVVIALLTRYGEADATGATSTEAPLSAAISAGDVPPSPAPPVLDPPVSPPDSPAALASAAPVAAGGTPAPPVAARRAGPAARPAPAASASAKPARPGYCDTDEGFVFDTRGRLTPRAECR